ncbi:hypothetical protein E4K72_12840 [Oxalobacteraceae bacterium OM1]|nr:hypothetical protein E4K72_12840 [Oxalobacteraceae bacterium OM1]
MTDEHDRSTKVCITFDCFPHRNSQLPPQPFFKAASAFTLLPCRNETLFRPIDLQPHLISESDMNAKHFFLIPVLAIAGAAFADAPEQYVDHSRYVGTKSRAEVKAEAVAANANAERIYANGQYAIDMVSNSAPTQLASKPAERVGGGNYSMLAGEHLIGG